MLIAEASAEKVVGGILLPFYVLVPLWKLKEGAASVKAAVKEAASEEGAVPWACVEQLLELCPALVTLPDGDGMLPVQRTRVAGAAARRARLPSPRGR